MHSKQILCNIGKVVYRYYFFILLQQDSHKYPSVPTSGSQNLPALTDIEPVLTQIVMHCSNTNASIMHSMLWTEKLVLKTILGSIFRVSHGFCKQLY